MNPAFTVLKMTGLLAAEVAVVCLIVLGCEALMGSAPGRRTLWQVCILSVLLVTGLELSGLGRLLGETVRRSGPSKDTRAAPRFEQISTATPAIASPEPFMHIAPAAMQTAVKPAAAKNRPRPIVLALMCVWVAGTSILLCRIVVTRTIMLVICARSTDVIDPALIRVVRELSGQMAIRGGIRIIESARFRAPIAFGLVRRVIGLPPDFGAEHLAAHREVILAHELAHLAARDSWWQLLADFTVMLLWWHPMVWLARRRLQEASEAAADEASLLFPNGPSILAECLLAMGKLIDHAPLRGSSIGGDGFRSGLGRRVQRLLELRKGPWHPRNKVRIALAKMFCPGVLVLGTVLGSGWISPAASMKGTGMNNPLWKRSLPAFALLAFLGSDKQTGAADKAAPPTVMVAGSEAKPGPSAKGQGAAMVRRKLERITLDMEADNLPLGSVINTLIDETRKRDPDKEGINFLLYNSESQGVLTIDPATGLPAPGAVPEPVDLNAVTIRILPPLRNVRLIDVLDAMMKVADRPLRYSIEDYGVLITQAKSKATSNVETRTFSVNPPDIFFKGIKSAFGIDVPNPLSREAQQQVFQELFPHLGIDWAAPKSVFYNELTGIVMVRAAPEDMTVITATMQTLGAMPLSDPSTTVATKKSKP